MAHPFRIADRFARVLGILILVLITIVALQSFTLMAFPLETLGHLFLGWALFLTRNIPKISWNGDTILSGVLGLAGGMAAAHYLGRRFLGAWRWRTTASIAAALPVLFFTSFLVPAIANSLRALASTPLLQRRGEFTDGAFLAGQIRNQLSDYSSEAGSYPMRLRDCLGELSGSSDDRYFLQHEGEFLFTGAGLPIESNASLPLLLCPPYERNGKVYRRSIGFDMKVRELEDRNTAAILRASMEAHRRINSAPSSTHD